MFLLHHNLGHQLLEQRLNKVPFKTYLLHKILLISVEMMAVKAVAMNALGMAVVLIPTGGEVRTPEIVAALHLPEGKHLAAADAPRHAAVHGIPQPDIKGEHHIKANLKAALGRLSCRFCPFSAILRAFLTIVGR